MSVEWRSLSAITRYILSRHELDRAAAEGLPEGSEDARAMPDEESVILLMGKAAMDMKSSLSTVPLIGLGRNLSGRINR